MAKTITDLTFPKRHPGRVDVFLDHGYAFTLKMMDAASYHRGQQLSQECIQHLCFQSDQLKAHDRAIGFLRHRSRSRLEMTQHLEKHGFSPAVIGLVVDRLVSNGLVDDRAVARQWVEHRCRFNPKGKVALRYELKQKGIDQAVIDAVLDDLDEVALACRAAKRKLHHWGQLPHNELRQKVIMFLQRRGFSYQKSLLAFEQSCSILNR